MMEISVQSTEVEWQPKRWIALLLGLFLQPLGMLYLARIRWAWFYFLLLPFARITEYWLLPHDKAIWLNDISSALIMLASGVHSYLLAKNGIFTLPRKWYSRWYGLTAIPMLPITGLLLVRCFLFESFSTPTSSMAPTVPRGSTLIAQKTGFGNYGAFGLSILRTQVTAKVERGDILVFQYPQDPKINYVKRVIGMSGDLISYKSRTLYINGIKAEVTPHLNNGMEQVIEERYGDKSWRTIINPACHADDFETKVPEHQYFVLGDNRDNSADSRYWGFVPERNLIGKVVYIIH